MNFNFSQYKIGLVLITQILGRQRNNPNDEERQRVVAVPNFFSDVE